MKRKFGGSTVSGKMIVTSAHHPQRGAIGRAHDKPRQRLPVCPHAADARHLDADFAAETANLTRAQILQQAGMAMLAQANALPNQVLTLLRG